MKVLIRNNVKYEEIVGRKEYLYDVFKLYFVNGKSFDSGFIVLESFPKREYDVFIIKGHADYVYKYLLNNAERINEHIIVAITCYPEPFKKLRLRGKKLYFPKVDSIDEAILYPGTEFGFNFDITDSEIDLYNSKNESINKRIEDSFVKLQ